MLVMAAAAPLEVRAGSSLPCRRRRQKFVDAGPHKARLLHFGLQTYMLLGQDERREDDTSVQPRQPVAAVNQFFNCDGEIA